MEINDEKITAVIEETLPKINSTRIANALEQEIITVIQQEIE